MNDFDRLRSEHIRVSILLTLAGDPGYSHNESILQQALALYGLTVSRDRVRTEIRWLEEQQLVSVRDVSGYLVATLSPRGEDVAAGRARVDGVKRPGPRG